MAQINIPNLPNRPAAVPLQHAVNRPTERGVAKFKDSEILCALVLHDEKTHTARLDGGERDFLEDADLAAWTRRLLAASP
jgi:hypothetical protein